MNTALHFLNNSWHPALKNLFLQGCAYCLSQCHTALKVFPNTQNCSFWNLGIRNVKYKDREVEKALNKHSEGAGWLSKRTDLFSQCSLPAKLLQQVLHLQITYNPLAFLMTHNRMWALAPYSVSDQKVKGFLKRSMMFPVVLSSFYIRISSQDVLLSSTAWHD